jgi:hypothetical protein
MMDADDLELFRRTMRDALAAHAGTRVDEVLAKVGWHDALDDDPRAAISVLFEAQGTLNASSTALDDVLGGLLAPGGGSGPAVVLPPPDRWQPPADVRGEELAVRGLASARILDQGAALVVARSPEGDIAVTAEVADLTLRPVSGMDPWLGLVEVTGDLRAPSSTEHLRPGVWETAARTGQLALAHELVGAAAAMLELARGHALERIQFGRPIAAFQAVSHRLADTLVATDAARAAVTVAWDDAEPQAGAVAKSLAGRAARIAARHCQQVLAGMGFTTEHPLHRYVRRALVLDQLLGSSRSLTREFGRQLVEDRRLPSPTRL